MAQRRTELAVIGAGPGGYAAAFLAADLGMEVTLIDPAPNPGGTCLYHGCIPSKALLHVARLISETREAERLGWAFGKPRIRFDALREWKSGVVSRLTQGLGGLVEQRGITYFRGSAAFQDNTTLSLRSSDGETDSLTFDHAVIATGSRAAQLPDLLPDSRAAAPRFMTARQALELEEIPDKLLVIGGGYIGLEMGSVYAAMGSAVTLVEMASSLLPGADRDLARVLVERISADFREVKTDTRVERFKVQKNGVMATLAGADGTEKRLFDKVLVAVGRQPHTTELGLERTDVEIGPDGFIQVDDQQRTAVSGIFAVGDVVRGPMLAHKATHEGRLAVEVIAGREVVSDVRAIPAVVYTDPEIAWVGLTEGEARRDKRRVKVIRFPWAASGRALTQERADGLTKLIVDPESERVLGVGIAGTGAGEMIAEGALAIEMGANAADLGLTLHPHPTLSETIKEAADAFYGTATSIYRPLKK